MTLEKANWTNREALIQKAAIAAILKTCSLVLLVMGAAFFAVPSFAQNKKDTTASVNSVLEDKFNQMIEYSRPGKNHELLAGIVGTWRAKGKHFNWTDSATSTEFVESSATVVRKSFANGRYYISDVIGDDTIQMPIQDGKMKDVQYQSIEIEGYDNVKKKFVRSFIVNNLLSSIQVSEGVYDPATKTITFESEVQTSPEVKLKHQLRFIFIDKDHYKWEDHYKWGGHQEENEKYKLGAEILFTRVPGK